MNIENDDGTLSLRRPSAPRPSNRWCWCFPERDYNDTAWYREHSLRSFACTMVVVLILLSTMTGYLEHAQDDLSNLNAVMGNTQPKHEYSLEPLLSTASADALEVMNKRGLEGWVVDQVLSAVFSCPGKLDPCPAILFRRPL